MALQPKLKDADADLVRGLAGNREAGPDGPRMLHYAERAKTTSPALALYESAGFTVAPEVAGSSPVAPAHLTPTLRTPNGQRFIAAISRRHRLSLAVGEAAD
jgi:hypothetical protein